jgi:CBS domain-containing protein
MADAVQTLEMSRKFGICLILDREKKLLGTITNGDIRRALIKQLSMDTLVTEVMNKDPAVVRSGYTLLEVRKLLVDRFVEMVPVLDDRGYVIDLVGGDSASR